MHFGLRARIVKPEIPFDFAQGRLSLRLKIGALGMTIQWAEIADKLVDLCVPSRLESDLQRVLSHAQ